MPRRIAAGALFTAAVGLSVGAIAAPAQADAYSPHQTYHAAAYAPDRMNGNDSWRSFTVQPTLNDEFGGRPGYGDPCGCSPDRVRGLGNEDHGTWPLAGGDRDVRVVDERSYPVQVVQNDRRDCPPDRNREDGFSTIDYTVHPVVDDRRDCPPDRTRIYRQDTSYIGDHDFRGGDRHSRGDDHNQRDYRHDQGGHGRRR
ncbi:hypothetical protein KDL01_15425 [Actinospica durhamensis]|uniref:Uncharacterized protein n=1 Tax=Actinospica durhamensis TaxID=1508375 RepID=A0A941EVF7_9ACTN|nr:hypothetical protein [Actinospica durhamensis]MBR7834664.1 hypothetical protein [Actinospica durhamensis]